MDGSQRRRLSRWTKVLLWFGGVLVTAALAFAILQPIKVLPRIRVAPGFALVDQHGDALTSEDGRGAVTLYSFLPVDSLACGAVCTDTHATLLDVQRRVEGIDFDDTDFRIVTIALADDPDAAALTAAAELSGADGEQWRWVGGDWDRVRSVVGAGFRVFFDQTADGGIEFDRGYVLVDGNGTIRGEYKYRTLTDDADKLVGQLDSLATEIRNSGGAAGLAYEAAHLFSCYG